MTLNFTETEVPAQVSTRTAEPNPFDGKFPLSEADENGEYPAKDTKALAVKVNGDKESKDVKKVVSQARQAAIAVDRTARVVMEEETQGTGKNKKVVTTLTFWTVNRITRPRTNNAESNGNG